MELKKNYKSLHMKNVDVFKQSVKSSFLALSLDGLGSWGQDGRS